MTDALKKLKNICDRWKCIQEKNYNLIFLVKVMLYLDVIPAIIANGYFVFPDY